MMIVVQGCSDRGIWEKMQKGNKCKKKKRQPPNRANRRFSCFSASEKELCEYKSLSFFFPFAPRRRWLMQTNKNCSKSASLTLMSHNMTW